MTSCHKKEDWQLQKLSSSSRFKEKFMPGTVSLKMTKIHFKRPVKQSRRRKRRGKMKRVKEEKGKRK
jgi:hypothetical protein